MYHHPLRTACLAAMVLGFAFPFARADQNDADFLAFLGQNHYGEVRAIDGRRNKIYFDARINGKRVQFVLDTGAGETIITASCARRLGLAVKDSGKVSYGVGGALAGHTGIAPISSFTINNWEINHFQTIHVFPPGSDPAASDGLFGLDSLAINSAVIIVGGGGFLIRPGPGRGISLAPCLQKMGFTEVPLRLAQNQFLAAGSVNGQPLEAQIDCGAEFTIFQPAYLKKNKFAWAMTPFHFRGLNEKKIESAQFAVDKLTLGAFQAPSTDMFVAPFPYMKKSPVDVLIGYDFLAQYRAIIDAGSNMLWLK